MAEIKGRRESSEKIVEYNSEGAVIGSAVRGEDVITGCSNVLAYVVDEDYNEYILVQERAEGKDKEGYLEIPGGHQVFEGAEAEEPKHKALRELREEALAGKVDLSPSELEESAEFYKNYAGNPQWVNSFELDISNRLEMPENSPESIEPDILEPDPEEVKDAYLLRAEKLYERVRKNEDNFTFSSLGAVVKHGVTRNHLDEDEAKQILDEAKPRYSFKDGWAVTYTPTLDD